MTLDTSGGVIQTTKAVLHKDDAKFFLLVREPDGTWGLPGGAKDVEDFDLLDALKRELWEELSLEPNDYDVVDIKIRTEFLYTQTESERSGLKGLNNFFLVKIKNFGKIEKGGGLLELRWLEADEATSALEHDAMRNGFRRTVTMLKEGLIQ